VTVATFAAPSVVPVPATLLSCSWKVSAPSSCPSSMSGTMMVLFSSPAAKERRPTVVAKSQRANAPPLLFTVSAHPTVKVSLSTVR
jgi:hypothetical protein